MKNKEVPSKDKRRVISFSDADNDIREYLNNNPCGDRFSVYVKELIRADMRRVNVNLDDLVRLMQMQTLAQVGVAPAPAPTITPAVVPVVEEKKEDMSKATKKASNKLLNRRSALKRDS